MHVGSQLAPVRPAVLAVTSPFAATEKALAESSLAYLGHFKQLLKEEEGSKHAAQTAVLDEVLIPCFGLHQRHPAQRFVR